MAKIGKSEFDSRKSLTCVYEKSVNIKKKPQNDT